MTVYIYTFLYVEILFLRYAWQLSTEKLFVTGLRLNCKEFESIPVLAINSTNSQCLLVNFHTPLNKSFCNIRMYIYIYINIHQTAKIYWIQKKITVSDMCLQSRVFCYAYLPPHETLQNDWTQNTHFLGKHACLAYSIAFKENDSFCISTS